MNLLWWLWDKPATVVSPPGRRISIEGHLGTSIEITGSIADTIAVTGNIDTAIEIPGGIDVAKESTIRIYRREEPSIEVDLGEDVTGQEFVLQILTTGGTVLIEETATGSGETVTFGPLDPDDTDLTPDCYRFTVSRPAAGQGAVAAFGPCEVGWPRVPSG